MSKIKELDIAKKNVLLEIKKTGTLTDKEFDNLFPAFRIENNKRIKGKYLIFSPMWFICANKDKTHAFHLYAAHKLMEEGVIGHKNNRYFLLNKKTNIFNKDLKHLTRKTFWKQIADFLTWKPGF